MKLLKSKRIGKIIVSLSATSILPVVVSCSNNSSDINAFIKSYNDNEAKHSSVFETIIKVPGRGDVLSSYLSFTSTFLTKENNMAYFIASRPNIDTINQKEVEITLVNTNLLPTHSPTYYFGGKVKFNVIHSADNYFIYSLDEKQLSTDISKKPIDVRWTLSQPLLKELQPQHNLIGGFDAIDGTALQNDKIISYTPIHSNSLLYRQPLFSVFNILKSIVSPTSEVKSKKANELVYTNPAFINNQFFGSPLFYDKKIVGILTKYKNNETNQNQTHSVTFHLFTQNEISNIKKAINDAKLKGGNGA